ncbi:MAG TPA: SDR family NAD(P)-dependent oxidoreductase [Solirubrobacteraceae bacterium]|nr:SDR family NAD(P)-dependent oxidoreductase [Solirubrobacteraceae bacterium]
MSWDIEGRTVLITGAARGIGADAAERLHARGANVALVGLEPERLEALVAKLGSDRAAAFEADVTSPEALERAVAGTVERFGALDVAVANAGLHFVGALTTAPLAQLERELQVNLHGVLHTVRAAAPHVVARKGYLLNVASLAAASHAPLMGAYAASKAGVEAMTNALRQELRPTGTRVGCAYFGFIETDLVRESFEHPSSRTLERLMPKFVRETVPVGDAGAAIERAVAGRKGRVWAPKYVGGALALRGVLQPLIEARALRDTSIADAVAQADPATGALDGQDLALGVARRRADNAPEPSTPDLAGAA